MVGVEEEEEEEEGSKDRGSTGGRARPQNMYGCRDVLAGNLCLTHSKQGAADERASDDFNSHLSQ